jgi:shikimate kinase
MVRKIILVGYMAVGKTTIGKELAKKTNLKYFDLDELIEKNENKTISELFNQKGELYFRKIEHQIFETLITNEDSFVLSTGGGTPCYYNNHLFLEDKKVSSVYLNASIDLIFERLIKENYHRPLINKLKETELKEFISKHLFERSFFYLKARIKISVDNKSIDQICEELMKRLF